MKKISVGQRWKYNSAYVKDIVEVLEKGEIGRQCWMCKTLQVIKGNPSDKVDSINEYDFKLNDSNWEYLEGQDKVCE